MTSVAPFPEGSSRSGARALVLPALSAYCPSEGASSMVSQVPPTADHPLEAPTALAVRVMLVGSPSGGGLTCPCPEETGRPMTVSSGSTPMELTLRLKVLSSVAFPSIITAT